MSIYFLIFFYFLSNNDLFIKNTYIIHYFSTKPFFENNFHFFALL